MGTAGTENDPAFRSHSFDQDSQIGNASVRPCHNEIFICAHDSRQECGGCCHETAWKRGETICQCAFIPGADKPNPIVSIGTKRYRRQECGKKNEASKLLTLKNNKINAITALEISCGA